MNVDEISTGSFDGVLSSEVTDEVVVTDADRQLAAETRPKVMDATGEVLRQPPPPEDPLQEELLSQLVQKSGGAGAYAEMSTTPVIRGPAIGKKTGFNGPFGNLATTREDVTDQYRANQKALKLAVGKFSPAKLAEFLEDMGIALDFNDKGEADFSKLWKEDSSRSALDNYQRTVEMADMLDRSIRFAVGLIGPRADEEIQYKESFPGMLEVFKFFDEIGGLPYDSDVNYQSVGLLWQLVSLSERNHDLLMKSLQAVKDIIGNRRMANRKEYTSLGQTLKAIMQNESGDFEKAVKKEVNLRFWDL